MSTITTTLKMIGAVATASVLYLSAPAPLLAAAQEKAKEQQEYKVLEVIPDKGALGQYITVRISNLANWLKSNATPLPLAEGGLSKHVLCLNNIPLPNVHAVRRAGNDGLVFLLERPKTSGDDAEKAREAWAAVLGKPDGFAKEVSVSVGYGVQGPLDTTAAPFTFKVIPIDMWFWASVAAFGLLLGLFWLLATISNLIRDPGPDPDGSGGQGLIPVNPFVWNKWIRKEWIKKRKPFSLAYAQMAFWTFLVFGSYLFLWIVTQDRDILPAGALVLLGISSVTALSAVLIETGKRGAAQSARTQESILTKAIEDLNARLEPDANPAPTADERDRIRRDLESTKKALAEIESGLATSPAATTPVSKGFFTDILSDGNGISLHRFQNVVWTVVLGIVFLASVYNRLLMPTFSETLLALMGISGATYVGFKFPEAPKT